MRIRTLFVGVTAVAFSALALAQGPIGASLLAKLEPEGIKGLAFWDNGFKSFSANTPIRTPADLKGKDLLQSIYKETGFDPTKL